MKKENYRAEREFTGKVGAGVALFEAGWLIWRAVLKNNRALPQDSQGLSCVIS